MIIIFSILIIIYCFLLTILMVGWFRSISDKSLNNKSHYPFVSVIIPIRNEKDNIHFLLDDLNKQDYPIHLFEVIVVDDQSTDGSFEYIDQIKTKFKYPLQLIQLPHLNGKLSTKKMAVQMGVEIAKGEYILTTDGDCRVGEKWISTFANFFTSHEPNFVAGMVTFYGEDNLFHKLQTLEFAVTTGIGASTLQLGMPTMCNAANMAYKKEAFIKVNGYQNVDHIISGDDGFLLEKLASLNKSKIFFLKDKNSIVKTKPQSTFLEFFHQRKRWASKWRFHKKNSVAALAIYIFTFNALLLAILGLTISGAYPLTTFFIQLFFKSIFEFAFLRIIFNYLGKRLNFVIFLLLGMIYPFYAVFFGLAANVGGYKWKDRRYESGGIAAKAHNK